MNEGGGAVSLSLLPLFPFSSCPFPFSPSPRLPQFIYLSHPLRSRTPLNQWCVLGARGPDHAQPRMKANLVHSKAVSKPLVAIGFSLLKWMFYQSRPRLRGWRSVAGCWGECSDTPSPSPPAYAPEPDHPCRCRSCGPHATGQLLTAPKQQVREIDTQTILSEASNRGWQAVRSTRDNYGDSRGIPSSSASSALLESTDLRGHGNEHEPIPGSTHDVGRPSCVCAGQPYGHPRRPDDIAMLHQVLEEQQLPLLQLPNPAESTACLPTVRLPSAKSHQSRWLRSLCGKSHCDCFQGRRSARKTTRTESRPD